MKITFNSGKKAFPDPPSGHPEKRMDLIVEIGTSGKEPVPGEDMSGDTYGTAEGLMVDKETDKVLMIPDLTPTQLTALRHALDTMGDDVDAEFKRRGLTAVGVVANLKGGQKGTSPRSFIHGVGA